MKGISLQSHTPPGEYSLTATFEGLLELERYGFYICRRQGEGNGEFFTTIKFAELQQMWASLQAITRNRLWEAPYAHFAAWDAAYLLTATGHISHIATSRNLAGVINPESQPLRAIQGDSVRWYFRVGLVRRGFSQLPQAAKELLALIKKGPG